MVSVWVIWLHTCCIRSNHHGAAGKLPYPSRCFGDMDVSYWKSSTEATTWRTPETGCLFSSERVVVGGDEFGAKIFWKHWYCWWKKSCTSWGWLFIPFIYNVFYIPACRISEPSTVFRVFSTLPRWPALLFFGVGKGQGVDQLTN